MRSDRFASHLQHGVVASVIGTPTHPPYGRASARAAFRNRPPGRYAMVPASTLFPHVLRRAAIVAAAAALAAASLLSGSLGRSGTPIARASTGCDLQSAGDNIQHVIYSQFDNTHFRRDDPNVPSDLEQMPHLLNFIQSNGTLLTNDHTV